jgi:hypothetical protein
VGIISATWKYLWKPAAIPDIKVARVGAKATFAAALIGALLGGGVTGAFTLANTDKQLRGEADRSRTDFLRENGLKAYGTLLADARKVETFRETLRVAIMQSKILVPGAGGKISYPISDEQLEKVKAAFNDYDRDARGLWVDIDAVDMVGSPLAQQAVLEFAEWHRLMSVLLQDTVHLLTATSPDDTSFLIPFEKYTNRMLDSLRALTGAIRINMDADQGWSK